MDSSQRPSLSDQDHEGEVASLVPKEPLTVEKARAYGPAHDADVTRDSSDQSVKVARNGFDFSVELPAAEPSIRVPPRSSAQFVSDRPSIGKRIFRSLARFFIAVLIGIGATLAWQSHGNEVKEMARTWVPSLGWLLSVSMTKSPSDLKIDAEQKVSAPAGPVFAQDATSPSVTEKEAPPPGASTSELMQQLEAMARDLTVVRRSVAQLKEKQDQMAQNVAALQAAEQDIRKRISPPTVAVPLPPRKNTPSTTARAIPAAQTPSTPRPSGISPPPLPLR